MKITAMRDINERAKFLSLEEISGKQMTNSSPKNDIIYQRNALLTFKKPTKISKKQLLQMLTKKNTMVSGTFALQNNKILLITETKQSPKQPHPPSFRKKYMKTNFKRKQNQNMSEQSIKEQIIAPFQKKQHLNIDILKKYFAKNHLYNSESGQIKYLKGFKLIMNGSMLSEVQKDSQDWREQRLEKRNRPIQFVNNFMRTRYKTVHSDKEDYKTFRQNHVTHTNFNFGRHSDLQRNKCLLEPWQKKEEYEQFQL